MTAQELEVLREKVRRFNHILSPNVAKVLEHVDALERENARLREALSVISKLQGNDTARGIAEAALRAALKESP